jgi:NAD(P)-dependent dehydrogenase (short-subunit alcohol dehydrogenase family)
MNRPTCLITGTTHGIGRVTAQRVAERGYRVVMACRDPTRAETVKTELINSTGNPDIHVLQCDLASLDSVRRCAAAFTERFDALTLLINNAGTMTDRPQASVDGFELTYACNHLGPFLLTRLLLETLLASDTARIVTVASGVHNRGAADFAAAAKAPDSAEGGYNGMRAYATSKLANVMFTLSLAEFLKGSKVTANCLHPGVVGTNIVTDTSVWMRYGMKIARAFMFSPERGAATSIHLALSPEVEGISGSYFDQHQRIVQPAPAALNPDYRRSLWQLSEQHCELTPLRESR